MSAQRGGVSTQWGLPKGVSAWWVSARGSVCSGGLPRSSVCPGVVSAKGVSAQGGVCLRES